MLAKCLQKMLIKMLIKMLAKMLAKCNLQNACKNLYLELENFYNYQRNEINKISCVFRILAIACFIKLIIEINKLIITIKAIACIIFFFFLNFKKI